MRPADQSGSSQKVVPSNKEKKEASSTSDPKNSIDDHHKKQILSFFSMRFNPYIIDDPDNTKENASKDIFDANLIKSIRKIYQSLFVEIQERKQVSLLKKEFIGNFQFSDSKFQKCIEELHQRLNEGIPIYRQKFFSAKGIVHESMFIHLVQRLQGQSYMAWFLSFKGEGPQLKFLTFSEKLLQQIGLEPQEFPIEIQKYKECSLDFINGVTYRAAFLTFLETLEKFLKLDHPYSFSKEQIVRLSQRTVINEIRGNKQVILEMKITVPEPFIILFETTSILSQKNILGPAHRASKQERTESIHNNVFKTLHKITKLPSSMNKQPNPKMCGYVVLSRNRRGPKRKN